MAHKNGLPNFIGTFTSSDSSDFKLFESIITNHRTVGRFWVIINPKTEKSSVVVHRPDEPETSTISWSLGQLSLEELESFIRTECLSWFGTFDSINHSLYTESNKDLLWLIGTRNDRNRLFQILQNIGKRLRSELRPVWIDVTQFKQKSAGQSNISLSLSLFVFQSFLVESHHPPLSIIHKIVRAILF